MWDLAVREDDYRGAEEMVQRMSRPPLSMRVLLTFASGDAAKRASIVEEARGFDSFQSQIGGRYVATFLEDFAAAESLARLDLAERRRAPIRVNAQIFIAWLEVARGRWSAARTAWGSDAWPGGKGPNFRGGWSRERDGARGKDHLTLPQVLEGLA